MSSFTISSTVKHYPTHLPYTEIKEAILGKRYNLSLAFVGATTAATLNQEYRKKTYSPNVLSFPLTEKAGEIVICLHATKKEAAVYDLSQEGYIAFLFIHGCLHLKGHDHGDTMEKLERKFCNTFNIS